jgi:hypothetical protein
MSPLVQCGDRATSLFAAAVMGIADIKHTLTRGASICEYTALCRRSKVSGSAALRSPRRADHDAPVSVALRGSENAASSR